VLIGCSVDTMWCVNVGHHVRPFGQAAVSWLNGIILLIILPLAS